MNTRFSLANVFKEERSSPAYLGAICSLAKRKYFAMSEESKALLDAAKGGYLDLVKELRREPECDMNHGGSGRMFGKTALHLGIKHHHLDVVKFLVSLPEIEINKRAKRGDSALHFAVNVDSTEFLKVVLSHPDVDLEPKNSKGETPLDIANKSYHEHHVVLLESALKDRSEFQATYVSAGPREFNVPGEKREPIEERAKGTGGASEKEPEVRKHTSTAASEKEASQALEIKEFLVSAFNGNLGRVMNLLKSGVSLNVAGSGEMSGRTALHLASLKGHLHVMKFLLEKDGIQINKQNKSGNTALHFAVKSGNAEAVELILKHPGVDVSIKNSSGNTALAEAEKTNASYQIVELLRAAPTV